ncbi:polysaccharide biosynthesis C-terminal domain-containing protein [Devosia ginsengisoli]|uniref:polysaccharide biosynthesis C-terminal domain-containing protein n=1 Tax=Devosia ginsengisoli TaxID=400770 RepID=UPI0026EB46DB|nr:polysaccharide biosynthesis C-terminal domain-containing protein [Devosia ginsengisoli]MCR6673598.1 polysaccharide biosynthesis C-terminal domain-containing protein [Devosia ginsengisoli]
MLIATGRGAIFGLINLVAVLINISLNFLLIPQLGATGAALASMGGTAIMLGWQATTIFRYRHRIILPMTPTNPAID